MNETDDDLRLALARAADGVRAPSDPVGRVRAAVDRRRRRRTRVRLVSVSASAAALLVAAVVLAPGQLPDDAALPATTPIPSGEEVGVLLTPDGLPGVELGSTPDVSAAEEFQLRPTGSGCVAIDTRFSGVESLRPDSLIGTSLVVWLKDGVVVALVAFALTDRVRVDGDIPGTWLGPTLRSPVATALELPGARLVKDDPFGDAGPEINNVVVDAGGGTELVYSDAPLVEGSPSPGQVTTMVLRTEAGRGCRLVPGEDYLEPGGPWRGEVGITLGAQGTETLRLGGSISEAVAQGSAARLEQDFGDPLDHQGCTSYRGIAEELELWADGDRIVGIASLGGLPPFVLGPDPAIASGQYLDSVRSRPGSVLAATPATVPGTAVDIEVEPGVRARVLSNPAVVPAETTGALVTGPDVIDGILLYLGDAPADSLCTS